MEKQLLDLDESFIKKGRMKKSPFLMDAEELKDWECQVKQQTRDYLFSIGQPLVYKKDGVMVVEYADGRIKYC